MKTWLDATFCGVWSVSALFAHVPQNNATLIWVKQLSSRGRERMLLWLFYWRDHLWSICQRMLIVEREVTIIMHIWIQAWNLVEMFISMSNWNFSPWSIFKMAALKSKMAATINVKSWNEDFTSYKEIK